jgi:hypothetical protein
MGLDSVSGSMLVTAAGAAKARGVVDSGDEGQRRQGANAGHGHEPTEHSVVACDRDQHAIILPDLLKEAAAEQQVVVQLFHELALRAHRLQGLQQERAQQLLRRGRLPADVGV